MDLDFIKDMFEEFEILEIIELRTLKNDRYKVKYIDKSNMLNVRYFEETGE